MFKAIILSFAVLQLSACALMTRRSPAETAPKVYLTDSKGKKTEAPAQVTAKEEKEITPVKPEDYEKAQGQADEIVGAVAAASEKIQATHTEDVTPPAATAVAPPTSTAPSVTREVGPVPAVKSLGWLRNGNTRFVKGFLRADGASAKDRQRLMLGQKPHAVVITCSDSRMPPEIIFDQKLGEIFVVRTNAETLDASVISSAETAVGQLGTNLVVLLRNDSCGLGLSNDAELLERSAILRDGVASGEVKVVKALYSLQSGSVSWQ